MRLLIYEHLTAQPPGGPLEPLRPEGWAMLQALAEEFALQPGVTVAAVCHGDPPGELPDRVELMPADAWLRRVDAFDRVLPVAPETDGILTDVVGRIAAGGGKPWACDRDLLEAFGDKGQTDRLLGKLAPITLPATSRNLESLRGGDRTIICKPRRGAGATETYEVGIDQAVRFAEERFGRRRLAREFVWQTMYAGTPSSVPVIFRENGSFIILRAGRQLLTQEAERAGVRIGYRGGRLPDAAAGGIDLALRFIQALGAADALSKCRGWVGLDFVAGEGDRPAQLIEVNARMTTSLIGYRRWLADRPGIIGRMMLGTETHADRDRLNHDVPPVEYAAG